MSDTGNELSPTATPGRRAVIVGLWLMGAAGVSIGIVDAATAEPANAAVQTASPMAEAPPAKPANAAKLSVEEILGRNAKARGGLPAWHKVRTMVQIGRIERGDQIPGAAAREKRAVRLNPDAARVVAFRLEMERPNKMRLELEYQGATAIQAFDGVNGYTVQPSPSGAVAHPFSDAQTRASAEQQDLEGPLLDATAKGTVVSLDGVDTVNGRPAYKLALALKSGTIRHVWVDAETFFDVKIDGTRQIGERTWPVETFFGDFRKVGNLQVPYEIQTAVGGVHTMERIMLAKVILNAPLEPSRFTLPRAPEPTPAKPRPASAGRRQPAP
jgi:hypothetical protein